MKRYLLIVFLFVSAIASAQVVNFGKTLPVGSYSIGVAASHNINTYVSDGGLSFMAFGGIGLSYSVDLNLKYSYHPQWDPTGVDQFGPHYIGADVQYLLKETRKSYFNIIGGMHYQDDFGFDLTGSYTYSPEFWINLTAGLDLDLMMADNLIFRAWIPLNAGINLGNIIYLFFEYDLPANEKAWDIISLGANFIIR
jgi:hypothetical protein